MAKTEVKQNGEIIFLDTKNLTWNVLKNKYLIFYEKMIEYIGSEKYKISEMIWLYQNRYNKPPTCGNNICNNGVKFIKFYKGYNKYCSKKCSAVDTHRNDEIKKKRLKGIEKSNKDIPTRKSMTT